MKRMILTSQPHDKLRADHFTPVQQSPKEARPKLLADGLIEPSVWPEPAAAMEKRRAFSKIRSHDWSTALLFIACDIVCWVVLYGFVGYARRDAFFVSPRTAARRMLDDARVPPERYRPLSADESLECQDVKVTAVRFVET